MHIEAIIESLQIITMYTTKYNGIKFHLYILISQLLCRLSCLQSKHHLSPIVDGWILALMTRVTHATPITF
jgi:hypothetical protein